MASGVEKNEYPKASSKLNICNLKTIRVFFLVYTWADTPLFDSFIFKLFAIIFYIFSNYCYLYLNKEQKSIAKYNTSAKY